MNAVDRPEQGKVVVAVVRSSWFPPQPSLAVQARRGDVWLGRGSQIPETFTGPGETAGEPFLLRGWDGEAVELLG